MGRFDERVAVVTGAGRGIGRACVVRFAQEGAAVVATSRTAESLEVTCNQARQAGAGATVEGRVLDVSSVDEVRRVIRDIAATFGRIDILVANAGIDLVHSPAIVDTTDDEWTRIFDVNVAGVFRVCREALPVMPDGASIVTVASMSSYVAWPDDAAYTASKGAVLQFTRALALEAGRRQVRANAVCPGVIDTSLTRAFLDRRDASATAAEFAAASPLNRIGTSTEVANVVAFLASDEASFVTGAGYLVDGGATARA